MGGGGGKRGYSIIDSFNLAANINHSMYGCHSFEFLRFMINPKNKKEICF